MDEINRGKLLIIGGAEDKKDKCIILKEVIKLSGGENSRIVIMTTATEKPEEVGKNYVEIFKRLGAVTVETVNIDSRDDVKNEIVKERLRNSTCIFFTGGDQLRITSILGGSGIDKLLNELNKRKGILVVGTSAGASVMSRTMIIGGNDEESPRKCTINMAPGLGLLNNVIIDQHFAQRGRIGRLLTAIAENPENLGVGIDEDTAIVVDGNKFRVIGSNAVTVVDGRTLKNTNVSESSPDEILSLTHVTLHILPSGYGFDIMLREPFKYNKEDK
ncbi:cyanophycinase [Thermoanaerobacterium thermosaccharolyticum]|jgi:cyanophycinase|uniref:Cyanophycinase n=3 Tax=Thermoanaerobacterium thermosaccharolyticum TaxID=1517 RepID=D9TRH5_THETC|nr:cyanophycinase [Thermoanaerobacterium thermosaccharolyticum]TCW35255.1 cyanophycinase [Thermohydrogenium kirishiense]ADL70183.1 cyanophycinase [Thermoanaerobacterium thermosaccharolyticum DSM 571]AGB20316.1 cyanophycinase [Thermoanaerobacterium thermosaccharolyticum M0795]AST57424.1 cyanophycinase [Thermoanaerobacterium thermosaccharolyticum]KAA5806554.1 cyanophycinase [Thermoanaerobacterium thermosaccharolyticum]